MNDDSTPGSFGNPQATSTPIFPGGGPRTVATPINALFQKSTPKNDAGFSDLVVRKPKVRFADLEGGLLDEQEEIPPKRYRPTPAPSTREASLMMPDRVHSPIRTPTFPVDKVMVMDIVSEPSVSESQSQQCQSAFQVPGDLTQWSVGFRSNVSTNVDISVGHEQEENRMEVTDPTPAGSDYLAKLLQENRMEVTDQTPSGSDYLAKLLQESDETEESESMLQVEDTYLTKLREDNGRREMAEPIQAENPSQAYMIKLREYRRCMLDFVKKKGEQRAIVKQAEEAVRGKITLLGKTMRKVDGEVKAALERLRSMESRR